MMLWWRDVAGVSHLYGTPVENCRRCHSSRGIFSAADVVTSLGREAAPSPTPTIHITAAQRGSSRLARRHVHR